MSGAVRSSVGLELLDGIPLVVAGKDDGLCRASSGDRALVGALDVDEAVQDVEPGVLGPHAFPQV
ncbi:MAG TPA: hypothetical protein VIJ34_00200 [Acidimicrobiales bacterium]